MSRIKSKVIRYQCSHDHSQTESCGGHELYIEQHITSDTVSIWQDGEIILTIDDGTYCAILAAIESFKDGR